MRFLRTDKTSTEGLFEIFFFHKNVPSFILLPLTFPLSSSPLDLSGVEYHFRPDEEWRGLLLSFAHHRQQPAEWNSFLYKQLTTDRLCYLDDKSPGQGNNSKTPKLELIVLSNGFSLARHDTHCQRRIHRMPEFNSTTTSMRMLVDVQSGLCCCCCCKDWSLLLAGSKIVAGMSRHLLIRRSTKRKRDRRRFDSAGRKTNIPRSKAQAQNQHTYRQRGRQQLLNAMLFMALLLSITILFLLKS